MEALEEAEKSIVADVVGKNPDLVLEEREKVFVILAKTWPLN